MNMTLKFSLAAVLTVAVAACAITAEKVSSMRGSDVAATDVAPIDQPYLGSKPGQHALIARTFTGQPPLVPHKVDGLDEITATDNSCLDCHIHDEFRGQKIPRVKQSHLVTPVSVGAAPVLDMQRWQCNSCHVPQIDAKPLVENSFKGNLSR